MQQIGWDKNLIACTLVKVKVAFLMNFKIYKLFQDIWSVRVNSTILYRSLQFIAETIELSPTSNHWPFVTNETSIGDLARILKRQFGS